MCSIITLSFEATAVLLAAGARTAQGLLESAWEFRRSICQLQVRGVGLGARRLGGLELFDFACGDAQLRTCIMVAVPGWLQRSGLPVWDASLHFLLCLVFWDRGALGVPLDWFPPEASAREPLHTLAVINSTLAPFTVAYAVFSCLRSCLI